MRDPMAGCRALPTEISEIGSGTVQPASWLPRLAMAVRRWLAATGRRRLIRRDIARLMALDDRMLADIGLSRAAIEHAVGNGRLPDWTRGEARGRTGSGASARHVAEVILITRARRRT